MATIPCQHIDGHQMRQNDMGSIRVPYGNMGLNGLNVGMPAELLPPVFADVGLAWLWYNKTSIYEVPLWTSVLGTWRIYLMKHTYDNLHDIKSTDTHTPGLNPQTLRLKANASAISWSNTQIDTNVLITKVFILVLERYKYSYKYFTSKYLSSNCFSPTHFYFNPMYMYFGHELAQLQIKF